MGNTAMAHKPFQIWWFRGNWVTWNICKCSKRPVILCYERSEDRRFYFIYISINCHLSLLSKRVNPNTRMTFSLVSEQYLVIYPVLTTIYVSNLIYLILVQKIQYKPMVNGCCSK